ncbi:MULTISPECIES: phosphatase PAP2 family protein [Paenibacillus]|uniref:Undecaprenyl-diphosphatase n=1 Tax=Paenibacillus silagei TaxID=1670801 RepID=A0ABS4NQM6_9BACL|nr:MULTISPECIES: phosphatase PAP2 family protein [Paenibacillus]ETT63354.1 phosphoesterase PA-phosphatase-like protein [Paenibacillus sp. FSL R7-277]MBP2112361.1 undecaprenyl-diphosphatase [Paenibacillus silagei]
MLYYHYWSRGFRRFIWFLLAFILIALLVKLGGAEGFDHAVIRFVQSMESPPLTALAKGLSLVGSSKLAVGISLLTMLILFFALKHRLELALFLWVGLGSQLLNTLLKLWFHRERPTIHRLIEQTGYSFPSGHSMAAFSLYGVIAYLLWRHMHNRSERLLLILFTVLMTGGIGWSRIYLGVHYPSDVIGGYAASGAWLMLSAACFEAYRNYKANPRNTKNARK